MVPIWEAWGRDGWLAICDWIILGWLAICDWIILGWLAICDWIILGSPLVSETTRELPLGAPRVDIGWLIICDW
jgi:hypothetical protein